MRFPLAPKVGTWLRFLVLRGSLLSLCFEERLLLNSESSSPGLRSFVIVALNCFKRGRAFGHRDMVEVDVEYFSAIVESEVAILRVKSRHIS